MKFSFQFQNLFHFKTKRIAFLMGLIVIIHLPFQPLVLHSGNTLHSLSSNDKEDIDPKFIEAESVLTDGVKSETRDKIALTLQDNKSKSSNESMAIEKFVRRMRGRTFTFSEMNSILIKSPASSGSLRRRLSARERELLPAKKRIKIAHAHSSNTKINPELHPSLFRNVSMLQRSYELMERTLKIYIYKEGEKPIHHNPRLRRLYCAEGWFVNLLQRSRHFEAKDSRKAHLFYFLPFSSELLRITIYQQDKSPSLKKLEMHLMNYVALY